MFCLDANIVVAIVNVRASRLAERLRTELARGTRLIIPSIVLFELRYGAATSDRPARNRARLDEFLVAVHEIAVFDADDATEAGDIRAHLEGRGQSIGLYDILIAAQTRRRGAALVSLNRREFERVPGLMVTDWAV